MLKINEIETIVRNGGHASHYRYLTAFPSLEELKREQTRILEAGKKLNPEIAFCHMDFQPQNMLLIDDDDDEGKIEKSS